MLSDTQRKLVEDNIKLVFYCLKKNKLSNDWQDVGFIGLCKAAKSFKEGYNWSFSTYAVKCINNELHFAQRKDFRAQQLTGGVNLSLDQVIYSNDEDSIYLIDMIHGSQNSIKRKQILNNYYEYIQSIQNEKYKRIMELFYLGFSQNEISKILGNVAQATISRIIKKQNQKFIHIYYGGLQLADLLEEE